MMSIQTGPPKRRGGQRPCWPPQSLRAARGPSAIQSNLRNDRLSHVLPPSTLIPQRSSLIPHPSSLNRPVPLTQVQGHAWCNPDSSPKAEGHFRIPLALRRIRVLTISMFCLDGSIFLMDDEPGRRIPTRAPPSRAPPAVQPYGLHCDGPLWRWNTIRTNNHDRGSGWIGSEKRRDRRAFDSLLRSQNVSCPPARRSQNPLMRCLEDEQGVCPIVQLHGPEIDRAGLARA